MSALAGIRILDLSRLLPGPLCTQMLGDLGADVIKIEEPQGGDPTREMGASLDGQTVLFSMLNRNKRSLTLHLKHPKGIEIFKSLAAKADVVVDGFRPGVMDRLGIGYETLAKDHPRLIYCAITGYGQTGPYKDRAGHDFNYMSTAGAALLTGVPSGPAALPGIQFADIAGGAYLAFGGILAALFSRERTGQGQMVDVSMSDGAAAGISLHLGTALTGHNPLWGRDFLNGGWPPYGIYETKDGRYMACAALEPKFWMKLAGLLMQDDPEGVNPLGLGGEELRSYLVRRFKDKTRDEWTALLAEADVCVTPALEPAEAWNDPHMQARGTFSGGPGSIQGGSPKVAFPVRMSGTRADYRLEPPELGQHTEEILKECGISGEALELLRNERVI